MKRARQGEAIRSVLSLLLVGLVIGSGSAVVALADDPDGDAKPGPEPFPDRPKAPPLSGGLGWLNSAGPIELSKLKGKIVLLDFWTYCCINCMHILPDLAKLEAEFPNELVVIGIHSAKFEGEKDSQNIRDAIMRYEIKHPVVNDGQMAIWRRYGVNSWPTQVLIDPLGRYIGNASGEGNYGVVRDVILQLIKYHERKGTLDRRPLHFMQESLGREATPLLYPGKLLVDKSSNRLFISDSGHHRVVIARPDGSEVLEVVGTGQGSLDDGPFEKATFFEPQGLALAGDLLYVADRKNHVIRELNLKDRTVRTIAGTGSQGHERSQSGPAREIPLASPWDVLWRENELYIAMAGTHQIWRLDLTKKVLSPYAGNGRENLADGDWASSNFAQPSGLSADASYLYVADSETSSVRKIHFSDATVETLVGRGLFDFGDIDGPPEKARLQHALAVDVAGKQLFVADTYNNKLKTINLETGRVLSFVGDGRGELSDDPPRFDEPSDVQVVGTELFVADTNNHAIRVVDRETKKVRTLTLSGLVPPPARDEEPSTQDKPKYVPAVVLAADKSVTIKARVAIEQDEKLNPEAPMSYTLYAIDLKGEPKRIGKGEFETVSDQVEMTLMTTEVKEASALRVSITYFPCQTGSEGVCRIATKSWQVPVSVAEDGALRIELEP